MRSSWEFLDEVDLKIIDILKKNGRKPFVEIGKELGLSEGAVRRRIRILQERGVIKRFTVELSKDYVINAVTFLSFEGGDLARDLVEKISNIPSVEAVYELTGRFDAMVIISAKSVSDLNRCVDEIRRLDGVRDTETAVILRIVK